jgi:hypothetical protein
LNTDHCLSLLAVNMKPTLIPSLQFSMRTAAFFVLFVALTTNVGGVIVARTGICPGYNFGIGARIDLGIGNGECKYVAPEEIILR